MQKIIFKQAKIEIYTIFFICYNNAGDWEGGLVADRAILPHIIGAFETPLQFCIKYMF